MNCGFLGLTEISETVFAGFEYRDHGFLILDGLKGLVTRVDLSAAR